MQSQILLLLIILWAGSNAALILNTTTTILEDYPPPDYIKMMKPFRDICIRSTGVKEALIVDFSNNKPVEDEKLKCYMHCMFKETNVLNDEGELNLGKLFVTLDPAMHGHAIRMGRNCLKTQGDTQCDRAFWYHNCWRQAEPEFFFMP